MPRFYFHLFNQITARDHEGRDVSDLRSAKILAVDDIRSIISDDARSGQLDLRGRIEIADEDGRTLTTVRFIEAFVVALPADCS
jgi:hypothetical protein